MPRGHGNCRAHSTWVGEAQAGEGGWKESLEVGAGGCTARARRTGRRKGKGLTLAAHRLPIWLNGGDEAPKLGYRSKDFKETAFRFSWGGGKILNRVSKF